MLLREPGPFGGSPGTGALLYQACTESVREARHHLAAGDIAARCQSISKAHRILAELTAALDHERGGDLSQRLARLYDYMQRRLLEANMRQDDAPMSEVLGLLSTLAEAWERFDTRRGTPRASQSLVSTHAVGTG